MTGMRSTKIAVALGGVLLVTAVIVATNQVAKEGGGHTGGSGAVLVGAQEAAQIIETDPKVFVVNVHVPYAGEIEGTDAFVPFDEVSDRLDEFPADRSAPVLLYCRSGRMSADAGHALLEAGFTHVLDLDGGMVAWESAGFPVATQ